MYFIVAFVFMILIIIAVFVYVRILRDTDTETVKSPIAVFDNSDVPVINPPTEIVVEGNVRECHKTLTPCTSHLDCDVCREGLANCQLFDEKTILNIRDSQTNTVTRHVIQPGESYCMALDRDRARSCNPHTGVWLLTESAVGFSLLCSCLAPGLVTQLNMYEDCNVAVGCQPNGRIADLNQTPLQCVCDEGFVASYNEETQTPYCRPRIVRDVIDDINFFPKAPCENGFVRIDHPALDDRYRRELRLNDICVVDPCSIDPISGQRTAGRLMYHKTSDDVEFKWCSCPAWDNLLGVYNPEPTMIGPSHTPFTNTCLQPFNVSLFNLHRTDYKVFWARASQEQSDDDFVAAVNTSQMSHSRYNRLLFDYLSDHPQLGSLRQLKLIKFSISYSPFLTLHRELDYITQYRQLSMYQWYVLLGRRTQGPCFNPGIGRCVIANHTDCIRRHANGVVGAAELFTGDRCLLSRGSGQLLIWDGAHRYDRGSFPVALWVNGLFGISIVSMRNDEFRTVRVVEGNKTVTADRFEDLATALNIFPNYSVH